MNVFASDCFQLGINIELYKFGFLELEGRKRIKVGLSQNDERRSRVESVKSSKMNHK